jgi:hypothetical protein
MFTSEDYNGVRTSDELLMSSKHNDREMYEGVFVTCKCM